LYFLGMPFLENVRDDIFYILFVLDLTYIFFFHCIYIRAYSLCETTVSSFVLSIVQ